MRLKPVLVLLCSLSVCMSTLLYSFENGVDGWAGGTSSSFSGSASQGPVYQNNTYPTLGSYGLRIAYDYNPSSTSKAVYFVNADWDFSSYSTFSFDIWRFVQPLKQVGLALSTGSNWEWHESIQKPIQFGLNTVTFNLNSNDWKTDSSNWQNNSPLKNKNTIKRIAILLFPDAYGFGEAIIDNVRVDSTSTSTSSSTSTSTTTAKATTTTAKATTTTSTTSTTTKSTSTSTTKAATTSSTTKGSTTTTTTTGVATTGSTTGSSGSGFVTRSGTQFRLNGCPFYFAGTNNYYVIYKSNIAVDNVLNDAVSMGLTVIRIWAMIDVGSLPNANVYRENIDGPKEGIYFHYWNGNAPAYNDGPNGLQKLDYVLAAARTRGIKLVLCLVNNWREFGGMDQYVAWYQQNYHTDFYSNSQIRQAFKNYVAHLVNRVNTVNQIVYKNDNTIFAWELTNELRCKGSGRFGYSTTSPAALISWVQEMSTYIKSIDPNHMVTVGDEGFFANKGSDWTENGSEGGDFINFMAAPNIDYGTFHIYTQDWGKDVAWGESWISDHIDAANVLGKPVVMEEFGWKGGDKTSKLDAYINKAVSKNIAGTNYWMLSSNMDDGGLYPDYDSYTIYNNNGADANLIKAHAANQKLKNIC